MSIMRILAAALNPIDIQTEPYQIGIRVTEFLAPLAGLVLHLGRVLVDGQLHAARFQPGDDRLGVGTQGLAHGEQVFVVPQAERHDGRLRVKIGVRQDESLGTAEGRPAQPEFDIADAGTHPLARLFDRT